MCKLIAVRVWEALGLENGPVVAGAVVRDVYELECDGCVFFFFSSRRRHTRLQGDWSSDVCFFRSAAAEKDAAAEEARIKVASDEDARKIIESAGQEIATAAKVARRELKAYAADLAVALAQRQIRVDPDTDQALVRTFAGQLSSTSSNGGPRKDRGE